MVICLNKVKKMEKIWSSIIKNGVFVTLALGASYLVSFYYQEGILAFYGIPLSYMELNIINVVKVFALTVIFLMFFFSISAPVFINSFGWNDYLIMKIIRGLLIVSSVIAIELTFFEKLTGVSFLSIKMFAVYAFYCVALPAMKVNGKMPYREKWLQYCNMMEEKDCKKCNFIGFNLTHKKYHEISFLLFFLIIICGVCNYAGRTQAKLQESYYLANNYDNKAIVYHTQNYCVLMENENGILKNIYEIVPTDELGTMSLEKIGPLKREI